MNFDTFKEDVERRIVSRRIYNGPHGNLCIASARTIVNNRYSLLRELHDAKKTVTQATTAILKNWLETKPAKTA